MGTDLARERFTDLRESSEYKTISDEAQKKQEELISVSEELQKESKTLSDEEKASMQKKAQTLISRSSVCKPKSTSSGK